MRYGRVSIALSLSVIFNLLGNQIAQGADIKVLNSENICTGAWGSSNILWQGPASRFTAARATTLTKATLSYSVTSGSNSPTNASNQRLAIWSNSGSNPGNLIGRMSYSSYSGNQVIFTGTVAIPSAGTYWLQILSGFSAYFCYVSTQNNSGSESGWSTQAGIAYGSTGSGETTSSFTLFGSPQNAYSFAYSLYSKAPDSISVARASNFMAQKGNIETITATTSGDGKVTFFSNGKRIPSCVSIRASNTSASCNWKPSIVGNTRITATFTPPGLPFVTSQPLLVNVTSRSSNR